jgi:hypothetical protein
MSDETLLSKYANNPYVRSLVQLIPNFGGAIDTLLYDKGSKWRQERIDYLFKSFNDKIEKNTKDTEKLKDDVRKKIDSEEFYNLFIKCAQATTLESNKVKIQEYANILSSFLTVDYEQSYEPELFFNITQEISQYEISKLAELFQNNIKYYKTYQHRICDLATYQTNWTGANSMNSFSMSDNIPDRYVISPNQLFAFNRLEKLFLITIEINNNSGSLPVNYSKQVQAGSSSIPYLEEIIYQITDFGKKYCSWLEIDT